MAYSQEQYALLAVLHDAVADGRLSATIDPHQIAKAWGDAVKLEADARALWAVRVLDAWAAGKGRDWSIHAVNGASRGCTLTAPLVKADTFERASDDAARLSAARAVWNELPESVRAEIGGGALTESCQYCGRRKASTADEYDNGLDGGQDICGRGLRTTEDAAYDCMSHQAHVSKLRLMRATSLLESARMLPLMGKPYIERVVGEINAFLAEKSMVKP